MLSLKNTRKFGKFTKGHPIPNPLFLCTAKYRFVFYIWGDQKLGVCEICKGSPFFERKKTVEFEREGNKSIGEFSVETEKR